MPGDSDHPVTLGDLRVSKTEATHPEYWSRPATVADLVSALRAEEGIVDRVADLLFQMDAGGWEGLVVFPHMDWRDQARSFLDALAEAQPFPPAGGVS